jgi:fermentation-respiration switch protein FrsA (DUF1100 family)
MTLTPNRLLTGAAALTALHVLDDATLSREPGTSVGDHLLGAGVLLLLLLGGTLLYPRVRAGARATLALLLGVLAVTMGALHVVELTSTGADAGDVTGLLALLGGVASFVVAAVVLWTSARRDGRRHLRRAGKTVGTAVGVYFLVLPVVVGIVITHKPRTGVPHANLGRAYEDVTLHTSDGLNLSGWYVPSRNGAAVIAFPGRRGPQQHARMLARHGYGVLLVDMRGNGDSDGDSNAFGWGSRKDLQAALDYLSNRPDVRHGAIGGLGLSVGGEMLLDTASADTRLAAVVSEGAGFRTIHEAVRIPGAKNLLQLPQDLLAVATTRVLSPYHPPKPLYELVPKIAPRPILLIQAGHGQGGEELNDLYYRRAHAPKQLWVIPEAHHTGGIDVRPAEYERRVVGFFDRSLLGR